MVHTCSICNYQTTRAFDYDRHMAKKKPCRPKLYRCVDDSDIAHIHENRNAKNEKIDDTGPCKQCSKCLKIFSQAYHMRSHQIKCDGFDKKQCKVCLRLFTTAQGKSKHMKYVKCNPVQKVINNNTINNNDNRTNINNNNQQYITNNIRLCFGNEDVSKLCTEEGYMERVADCIKMLKYAIPRSLEDVFFNDKYPENQTIKKDRRNDNMVNVHIGEGKWENRLAQDTMDGILNTIHNYMDKYINTAKLNPVARSRLKAFGREMSKLKDWDTEIIEDRLDIEPYKEPDDNDTRKTTKTISKLIKSKIYDETRKLSCASI